MAVYELHVFTFKKNSKDSQIQVLVLVHVKDVQLKHTAAGYTITVL